MAESTYLIGSEEVSKAGHRMERAAESISQSVLNLDETLERHRLAMEGLVERIEAAAMRE